MARARRRRLFWVGLGLGALAVALGAGAARRVAALPAGVPWRRGRRVGPEGTKQERDGVTDIAERPEDLARASGWDVNTYVFARAVGSEGGTAEQKIHHAWAMRNAAGYAGFPPADLHRWISPSGVLGNQTNAAKRPVATTRPPHEQDVAVARIVLAAPASADPTLGAARFLDVQTQRAAHAEWKAGKRKIRSRPPDEILADWTAEGWRVVKDVGGLVFLAPTPEKLKKLRRARVA